jgi:hypothetical protein
MPRNPISLSFVDRISGGESTSSEQMVALHVASQSTAGPDFHLVLDKTYELLVLLTFYISHTEAYPAVTEFVCSHGCSSSTQPRHHRPQLHN